MGIDRSKTLEAHKVLSHDHGVVDLERTKLKHARKNSGDEVLKYSDHDAEICVGPNCFDLCDDILLFSLFRSSDVYHDKGYGYGKPEQIQVKILSTILPRERGEFREGESKIGIAKNKKESVFIGQIVSAPKECALNEGMMVTSLRRGPVNAQYVTMPVDALISIPTGIDTGEATALVSTFVPAMGQLFHGVVDRSDRFSSTSLKGCDLLVTGGGSDAAGAVVSLALLCGANRIFVLQSKLSMATSHAESVRVELLSDDPAQWYPVIDRYMDLIVDLEYPKNFQALYGILKNTGRVVCKKPTKTGMLAPFHQMCLELDLFRYPNASIYDIDEQIENEHSEMVRDIRFLFRFLQKRKVRPCIDRFIKLKDIDITQEHMRLNPVSGAIICEPWR